MYGFRVSGCEGLGLIDFNVSGCLTNPRIPSWLGNPLRGPDIHTLLGDFPFNVLVA